MKPTEVRLVAALLQEDYDSPEQAAKEIIKALDQRRFDHDNNWCVIRPGVAGIYGPYPTQGMARKAISKAVSINAQGERVQLARLFRRIEEAE